MQRHGVVNTGAIISGRVKSHCTINSVTPSHSYQICRSLLIHYYNLNFEFQLIRNKFTLCIILMLREMVLEIKCDWK